jgi:hypothetical protein
VLLSRRFSVTSRLNGPVSTLESGSSRAPLARCRTSEAELGWRQVYRHDRNVDTEKIDGLAPVRKVCRCGIAEMVQRFVSVRRCYHSSADALYDL